MSATLQSELELNPEPDHSTFPPSLRGKRILLCTESFGPVNGVSRTTLMLVNHLRANGAIVAVVAPHNHTGQGTFLPGHGDTSNGKQPTTEDIPMSTGLQQPEVRIQGYPLPYNPELSIVYPVRLSQLYSRTFGSERKKPDLIYLASPASLGFQVMLQLRQQPADQQIPIIANFQTDLSGYCEILFPPPLSTLATWTFGAVQGWLFRHESVKTVFYPSRFVRRYLERTMALPRTGPLEGEGKLELLQRGVDTVMFHRSKRSERLRREIAPNGEIILLCVARLAPEKGFGFLAEVVKRLEDMNDRLKFKMYIVGGNKSPAVEEEIRGLFSPSYQQERGIKFAGFLVGEELATAYASADIFLHCSITETFGLVVLESMASGVPVIARDEGGPSDIVRHGESGYLVPPDELDMFVERVVMLATDGNLRKRLSLGARKQAEEMGWDRVNNKVAWSMAMVIRESQKDRERERAQEEDTELWEGSQGGRDDDLERGSLLDALDARLMGGMAAISATWVAVGGYLVFIKLNMWTKSLKWVWS
ncbi:glycosyltransferase [Naviculisporaceae sp. PSN 640]